MIVTYDEDYGRVELRVKSIHEEPYDSIPIDELVEMWQRSKQMPCEDAISRAWVKENMLKYGFSALDMTVTEFVEDAPSVAPSRPSGMDELVEGFAKALTYEDVITAEAEAKGYAQGFKDGMESRPSGEWKITNTYKDHNGRIVDRVEHTDCGYIWHREMGETLHNYCPNCGVKMRGTDDDYERAVEQMEYDMLYEPTYNPEDGSM